MRETQANSPCCISISFMVELSEECYRNEAQRVSNHPKELRKMTAKPSWAGIIELSQTKLQEKNASARGNNICKSMEETRI